MASSKHPSHKPQDGELGADTPELTDDLERNPGIGASKGTFARTPGDPETLEADNTSEGDVMNDGARGGGVNPAKTGRTNK